MPLQIKHLLGLEGVSAKDINLILDTARKFYQATDEPLRKYDHLKNKVVVNLFIEPSTRTRTSFELAARRLGADIVNFTASTSSFQKGETLKDTVLNLEAMKIDFIVIRHESAGAPHFLTTFCRSIVINAGDGGHEHPTQALLDLMTLREKFGNLKDLTVSIVGDILHSRVALSNIYGLKTMGARVIVCGPATLIPKEIEKLGVEVTSDVNDAIRRSDAMNILRIQLERQTTGLFPSLREYHHQWGITNERLKNARKQLVILHPGPINRGVELSSDVADGDRSVILQQVNYGVAVRMAVLTLLNGVEIQ